MSDLAIEKRCCRKYGYGSIIKHGSSAAGMARCSTRKTTACRVRIDGEKSKRFRRRMAGVINRERNTRSKPKDLANLQRRTQNSFRTVRQKNLCQETRFRCLYERTLYMCKTIKGGVLMDKRGSKTISGGIARLHLQSVDKK